MILFWGNFQTLCAKRWRGERKEGEKDWKSWWRWHGGSWRWSRSKECRLSPSSGRAELYEAAHAMKDLLGPQHEPNLLWFLLYPAIPSSNHNKTRNWARNQKKWIKNRIPVILKIFLLSCYLFHHFQCQVYFQTLNLITFRRVYYINICNIVKSDSFLTVCGKLFMVSSEHILSPQKALKKVKVEFTILSSSSVVDITDLETQL